MSTYCMITYRRRYSSMITYPFLQSGATIGVTAPSSGVQPNFHHLMKQSFSRMERKGYNIECGDTVWTQYKAKSASSRVRAEELNQMLQDDIIDVIIPPWGGELLLEIIEHLEFERFKPKWILGYSDVSSLLLSTTLTTGIATAHGTNLIDLRSEQSDETTAKWEAVLSTKVNENITQVSSEKYQMEWGAEEAGDSIFKLTEPTYWKVVGGTNVTMQGRLLGGCIDVIRHLFGTPYGDVKQFRQTFIDSDPLIWYLENCELSTVDLRRSLIQMKLAGWFEHCNGIMFGRSAANHPINGYSIEDVYTELHEELQIPIVYDIDCGHMPPQITLVNGAWGDVEVSEGKGSVTLRFK